MGMGLNVLVSAINCGNRNRVSTVSVRKSRLIIAVCRCLVRSGYLWSADSTGDSLRLALKYGESGRPLMKGLRLVSIPSRRVYKACKQLVSVNSGTGCLVVTSPRGVVSDVEARKAGVGGEVLLEVV